MSGRIITGHVLDVLAGMEPESVHCIVTSPPYFAVRAYGTEPQVWGGECSGRCQSDLPVLREAHEVNGRLLHQGMSPSVRGAEYDTGASPGEAIYPNGATVQVVRGEGACAHIWEGQGESATRIRNGAPGGIHEGRSTNKLVENITLHPSNGALCLCCGGWRGELGSERIVDCLAWARSEPPCAACYLCHLRMVLAALWRVLRADGVAFVNLGDSYAGGHGPSTNPGISRSLERDGRERLGGNRWAGVAPKNLLLVPQRFALAAQADGWIVRSLITWVKKAPMPESARDRPTNATEAIWLLAKQGAYFWDADAVREALAVPLHAPGNRKWPADDRNDGDRLDKVWGSDAGANMRNAWILGPQPRPDAHFATFPDEVPRRAIAAGTSEWGCCAACGAQWQRVTEPSESYLAALHGTRESAAGSTERRREANRIGNAFGDRPSELKNLNRRRGLGVGWHDHTDDALIGQRGVPPALTEPARRMIGWRPSCRCLPYGPYQTDAEYAAWRTVPATVLDPFIGSGTTGEVAERMGRNWIGIELNPEYVTKIAERRTAQRGFFQMAAD